jgi:hypothetical protein
VLIVARCVLVRLEDLLLIDLKNIFSLFAKSTTIKITHHRIKHGHSFNKVESIVQILHFNKKGARLDTIAKIAYLHRNDEE